jgi:hypothetical protein
MKILLLLSLALLVPPYPGSPFKFSKFPLLAQGVAGSQSWLVAPPSEAPIGSPPVRIKPWPKPWVDPLPLPQDPQTIEVSGIGEAT